MFELLLPMRIGSLLAVWVAAHFYHEHRTPQTTAIHELASFRKELASTRLTLLELQETQDHCGWRIWALSWSLRLSVALDLILLGWCIWNRETRAPRLPPSPLAITGDTGGSSESEKEETASPRVGGPKSGSSGGPSPRARRRPAPRTCGIDGDGGPHPRHQ